MQEKAKDIARPRTSTADIIDELRRLADSHRGCGMSYTSELADLSARRLAEQEETIRVLRSELVELSAKAMDYMDTIEVLRGHAT
jgi:putative heme degradation protein